ncbi:RNA 2',3'-cyclic phosphodiesterase [Patescibacteria group bacterium]|nr:RNA 2',3'-cyclic phosphodiesterase [Patescibacteria group bacterium]
MRCFLGIPLPADCRDAIKSAWHVQDNERSFLKFTDPGQWHVTLAFFGEVDYDHMINLVNLISRALEVPPQGSLKIQSIQSFPTKRPKLYVAKCEPEQKQAWYQTIEDIKDMSSLLAPQIDRKPWTPHVTLARTKQNKILDEYEMPLENIGWVPEFATLFRSELTPQGPHYTPLHEFRLNN